MERQMPRDWLGVVTGLGAVRQFEDLRLPCSLVTADQLGWLKIWGSEDNVVAHEILQGAEAARSEYNHRCLTQVQRSRRPLVASHGGFSDAFVPIFRQGRVSGFLVCGSFSTFQWKAPEIRKQWQELTRRPLRANDPELLSYAQAVLSTPVLPKPTARALLRVLSELAKMLGNAKRISLGRARWHRITQRYLHRRLHFNMWQMAAGLVDPIQQAAWSAVHRSWARRYLGLTRLPTLVLALSSGANRDRDALEALVEDHRFIVDCSDTALEIEDTACGRAGGSIAYFLLYCDPALPARAGKNAVRRLVENVRSRLRKKGYDNVHIGASARTPAPSALSRCLREALLALDWAVHKNEALVFHEDQAKEAALGPARFRALFDLTRALREGASEAAALALEGLVNETVWHSAATVTSARAYVDAFYSQTLRALGDLDLLEASVIADHLSGFQQAVEQASTVNAIAAAFRTHVLYLIEARKHPRSTRRDSKLARALRYLEAHPAEDLKLAEVAKMAGYAPQHFSRLLR
ncbi:MAG TPA: PocR ligand-binding domain-containing protein, partial [Polyangiaceae bacterium]|nr:PocR ligand-binding domain-containing protein [Polyangiaceae bacterium]